MTFVLLIIVVALLKKHHTMNRENFYFKLDKILPSNNNQTSPRIYLTRISFDGLYDFHEYSTSDPRFYKYLEYEPFKDIEESKNYLTRLLNLEDGVDKRTNISWFIRLADNDKVIGTARLIDIDFERQSVSWGYGISTEFWGQGYVFEVQEILLHYIFDTLKLNRLSGIARIDNLPTILTLKKMGFKEEGVLREAMRDFNGDYFDSWAYSMLSKDYFDIKNTNNFNKNNIIDIDSFLVIDELIQNLTQEYFEISEDLLLKKIPGWDSLMQMQLISALENNFDISLSMENIMQMDSVGKIKQILRSELNNLNA